MNELRETIPELTEIHRAILEERAARLYFEIQEGLKELNFVSKKLSAAGVFPQFRAIELTGVVLEAFNPDTAEASYVKRPSSKWGRVFWDRVAAKYGRSPDVLYRTHEGYVAAFNRSESGVSFYVTETYDQELIEQYGDSGLGCCILPSDPSMKSLIERFEDHCPSWAHLRE